MSGASDSSLGTRHSSLFVSVFLDRDRSVVRRQRDGARAGAELDAAGAVVFAVLVEAADVAARFGAAGHGAVAVGFDHYAGAVAAREPERERAVLGGRVEAAAVPVAAGQLHRDGAVGGVQLDGAGVAGE